MTAGAARVGLRLASGQSRSLYITFNVTSTTSSSPSSSTFTARPSSRSISTARQSPSLSLLGSRRPTTTLHRDPPPSTSDSSSSSSSASTSASCSSTSSFFTPSLCRISVRTFFSSARTNAKLNMKQPRPQSSSSTISIPTASATSTSPSSVAPTSSEAVKGSTVLDWNTFFRLRQSRRRYSLASSILGSLGTTGAMFVFLSTAPETADELTKLVPTDPFVSMGIFTFGATLLGWLMGPFFGNAVWRMFHRTRLPEFTIKERAFFERIKRNRVNPTGASTNNPVPDYYGEKIGSVGGYRRWLKDQRAFNRKRDGRYSPTDAFTPPS